MENKIMYKGELMEELLRNYFISLGYYVVRGVKYRYEGNDVTDIDLYLYGRSSSLKRDRINVDIKNKKTPAAFERILWSNGLRKLLNFDSCIVATTDSRPTVHSFGQIHSTQVLDGLFLAKLKKGTMPDRLSEEELHAILGKNKSFKVFNKDWKYLYELSKSKLLSEQDYSGFNSTILLLQYFLDKSIVDVQKRDDATRMMYLIISHLLIIMDFIAKDITFLNEEERQKKLSDGFNFGNLGKEGVDKILSIASQISGGKRIDLSQNNGTNILKEYFSKYEVTNNLFSWAKEFEKLGYSRVLTKPNDITSSAFRGLISVILDYSEIERRKFYQNYEADFSVKVDEIGQKEIGKKD